MFKHIKIRRMLSAYYDGELTPEDKRLVDIHVEACPDCRRRLADYRRISGALMSWTDEETTPDLRLKIQNKLLPRDADKEETMEGWHWKPVGAGVGVVVSLIAMVMAGQMYFKSGIQGRLRSAASDVGTQNVQVAVRMQSPASSAPALKETFHYGVSNRILQGDLAKKENVYEPYYLATDYSVQKDKADALGLAQSTRPAPGTKTGQGRVSEMARRTKDSGAFQADSYNTAVGLLNGLGGEMPFIPEESSTIPSVSPAVFADANTEDYTRIYENDFLNSVDNPLSTFSIDVDTASYANVRRFLNNNQLPPPDAARIEEMINYFTYDYPQPQGEEPFSITTELSACPWNREHQLLLVGLQGRTVDMAQVPSSNLVFLIDVSGSMNDAHKLPLLKSAFRLLAANLRPQDRVSIVTYAGAAGLVLDAAPGDRQDQIMAALDRLNAGGSTAGGAGIQLAYDIAKKNFITNGNNRVILATDGDFNVGVSSTSDLLRMVETKRQDRIFLTVLGFGMGNYKDGRLEQLADTGNGNAAYIDNLLEAKKVFVTGLTGTIFTIAKDVKVQVEFNPAQIKAYRLIGYENRLLAKEDFNNDQKDAGELGAGHSVTALYELVPSASSEAVTGTTDPLKYQEVSLRHSEEVLTVKLRYKRPDEDQSRLLTRVLDKGEGASSSNLTFASSVAEFGLILRDSQYKGTASYADVLTLARQSKGADTDGYRAEFIRLVEIAQMLDPRH